MSNLYTHQDSDRLPIILLFASTLFISASLMFVLQPMFGKVLLPLLGGSPAVWNACMVFYQTLVFLGYLYAHLLSTRLARQHQLTVHGFILLLSFVALPVALPENAIPPAESNPTLWLLWMLLLAIGLPFFVVSTTAPLLQKWFAGVGHQTSHDPYYLYTASNSGSLISLISYPFLLEPGIGLGDQKLFWSISYAALCLLVILCGLAFWRSNATSPEPEQQVDTDDEGLPLRTKLHWLALTFVPSSLLLGLTNFISTDIAAVPLLWVVPLCLYLLSFILVFSKWAGNIHPAMLMLQPVILLPFIAYSFINPAIIPYWLDLTLHLSAFFLAVMVCHGELAKNRPHTRHLTHFYLIMAFGGMLGGMFNTFIAPFIFNAVYEYPLMIVAALLLRPSPSTERDWKKQLLIDAAFPLALLVLGLTIYASLDELPQYLDSIGVTLLLLSGLNYSFHKRSVSLSLFTGIIIFFTLGLHSLVSSTLFQQRSFFGVHSVRESVLVNEKNQAETYHELFHGTTKHGAQRLAAHLKTTPLTYYSKPGPIGQLFEVYEDVDQQWSVGAVGLGTGALACYAGKQQHWTFFEIDPLVVEIARNPAYFSYLERCAPKAIIIIGDARLSLAQQADQSFDLLLMDAFSSDSVPTHLLTREALELYFAKLKPQGILAFHITNRHLELKKVLADHARKMGFAALIQEFEPKQAVPLVTAADWVVMTRQAATLEPLRQSRLGYWQKMPLYFSMRSWTDDFTNIISIWK